MTATGITDTPVRPQAPGERRPQPQEPASAFPIRDAASTSADEVLARLGLAGVLGFARLPLGFFLALARMTVAYLVLSELAKRKLYAERPPHLPHTRRRGRRHRIHRRAARFSVGSRQPTGGRR